MIENHICLNFFHSSRKSTYFSQNRGYFVIKNISRVFACLNNSSKSESNFLSGTLTKNRSSDNRLNVLRKRSSHDCFSGEYKLFLKTVSSTFQKRSDPVNNSIGVGLKKDGFANWTCTGM